ncbi:hypothetical protein ACJDU8_19980 [Clostridium sp. WILCCON 0269]|uniref:PDGLE domain-containing protein n=1 Tax=Candidatus Clostridium eludens TaxID=3381663 RepID=A0ABW8SP31_9CLOT
MRKKIGILVIVLGIISGIVFFHSGLQLKGTANNSKVVDSQIGTSLDKVYYQEFGEMNKGLGIFADACGLAIITISIGIGTKLIVNKKSVDDLKNTDNLKTENV